MPSDRTTKNKLYNTWQQMKQRCYNVRCKDYRNYGGRGISVSDEWRDNFNAFRDWALSHPSYASSMTIERVDVNGNYCSDNCTWITRREQTTNQQKTRWLIAFGEKKRISDWANDPRCKATRGGLSQRINAGWEPERAISEHPPGHWITAFGETKQLTEWVRDSRCSLGSIEALSYRLKNGWEPERAITQPSRFD